MVLGGLPVDLEAILVEVGVAVNAKVDELNERAYKIGG